VQLVLKSTIDQWKSGLVQERIISSIIADRVPPMLGFGYRVIALSLGSISGELYSSPLS
jgi:hypothetical protein